MPIFYRIIFGLRAGDRSWLHLNTRKYLTGLHYLSMVVYLALIAITTESVE